MSRPSSLPMLKHCSQFESSGKGNDYTDLGTERHAALMELLKGNPEPMAAMDRDSREGIQWAANYIKETCPGWKYICESWLPFYRGDDLLFPKGMGRVDIIAYEPAMHPLDGGKVVFDFKWRWDKTDYREQLAAYALLVMRTYGKDDLTCYVLFGEPKKAIEFRFTYEEAQDIVFPLVDGAGQGEHKPNDFCAWCSKLESCPAHVEQFKEAAIQTCNPVEWSLDNLRNDPVAMGATLTVARDLQKLITRLEEVAREMHEAGKTPEGFEVKERKGNSYITNPALARQRLDLPPVPMSKIIKVSKGDLVELYADTHDTTKAQAEREVIEKLGGLVERHPATWRLEKKKED